MLPSKRGTPNCTIRHVMMDGITCRVQMQGSEEADIADDKGADVVVELLCDALVFHHQVLP